MQQLGSIYTYILGQTDDSIRKKTGLASSLTCLSDWLAGQLSVSPAWNTGTSSLFLLVSWSDAKYRNRARVHGGERNCSGDGGRLLTYAYWSGAGEGGKEQLLF